MRLRNPCKTRNAFRANLQVCPTARFMGGTPARQGSIPFSNPPIPTLNLRSISVINHSHLKPIRLMKRTSWFAVVILGMCAGTASAQPFLQTLIGNGLSNPTGSRWTPTTSIRHRQREQSYHPLDPRTGGMTNLAGLAREPPGRTDGASIFSRFFNPQESCSTGAG